MTAMPMALSILSALWMAAAATGGGLLLLWACGLSTTLRQGERAVFAFVLGIGLIGWLAFFPGIFSHFDGTAFAVILVILSTGLVLMRADAEQDQGHVPLDPVARIMLAGLFLMAAMDITEALSPAADADTMAYHFETPRRFLAESTIYAIPRAIDGVTQLLVQTTYGVAMALGGERAANLWAMLTGWSVGAAFYMIANRQIGRTWALTGTLALLTIPAIVYAGGTGQVEVRLAAFSLMAAYAAAMSVRAAAASAAASGWAAIAGLLAGFAAGTKLTGLLLILAIAVSVLAARGGLRRVVVISVFAAVAGCQWYLFNWYSTGDPLYPLLWQYTTQTPGFEWNTGVAAQLTQMWDSENVVPRSLLWFFAYPVRTIIAPLPGFESLRTGLGPATLVGLPFAVFALWRLRRTVGMSLIYPVGITALVFYIVWFFFGPALRVRHLLLIYPMVLLCVVLGCARIAESGINFRRLLFGGFVGVICIQLGGQAVFTKKFIAHLLAHETDDAFLQRNISGYPAVKWINSKLTKSDRVLVANRDWLYRIEVPYLMAHPGLGTQIEIYRGATDVRRFIRQLEAAGITHAVVPVPSPGSAKVPLDNFLEKLQENGCARRIDGVTAVSVASRTITEMSKSSITYGVYAFDIVACNQL